MLVIKLKGARVSRDGFIYLYPNEKPHSRLDEHVAIGTNYV